MIRHRYIRLEEALETAGSQSKELDLARRHANQPKPKRNRDSPATRCRRIPHFLANPTLSAKSFNEDFRIARRIRPGAIALASTR